MPINKSRHINLIPQDEFELSDLGRTLKWMLSTFKTLVILTELIVMSAFLSRFWIDAKNSDLNEVLTTKKSQVLAYADTEKEFRLYQKKVLTIKNLYSDKKNTELISEVTRLIPNDITLLSVQEINNEIQIKAVSFSDRAIAQFLVNLTNLKSITDVNLTQVSSSVDNVAATTFTISATKGKGL